MTQAIKLKPEEEAMSKLTRARASLATSRPFFGVLCLKPRLVEATDRCKTMATDGKTFYYNIHFINKLSVPHLSGVLAHEALHNAFSHHLRRGQRLPDIWNMACDYAINPVLIKAGIQLPGKAIKWLVPGEGKSEDEPEEGYLMDPRFDGMTAEKIYDVIYREMPKSVIVRLKQQQEDKQKKDGNQQQGGGQGQQQQQQQQQGGGFSLPGEVWDQRADDGSELSKEERQEAEAEVASNNLQAEQAEKAVGNQTNDLVKALGDSSHSVKVDWWTALEDKLMQRKVYDMSFNRPNRRLLGHGYIMPGIQVEQTGELVFAIDTSGSLTDSDLAFIAKHCRDIVAKVDPDKVTVIYCDCSIKKVDEFERGDDLVLKRYGGGGTAFAPPFTYVKQQGIEPDALVYFTDGEGACNSPAGGEPPYPVIWASTGDMPSFHGVKRFGDYIKLHFD